MMEEETHKQEGQPKEEEGDQTQQPRKDLKSRRGDGSGRLTIATSSGTTHSAPPLLPRSSSYSSASVNSATESEATSGAGSRPSHGSGRYRGTAGVAMRDSPSPRMKPKLSRRFGSSRSSSSRNGRMHSGATWVAGSPRSAPVLPQQQQQQQDMYKSPVSQATGNTSGKSFQEAIGYDVALIHEALKILERGLKKPPKFIKGRDVIVVSRHEALVCHRALVMLLDPNVDDVQHRVHAFPDDVKQYLLHEFADSPRFRRLESAHSMRSIVSGAGSIRSTPAGSSSFMLRKSSFPPKTAIALLKAEANRGRTYSLGDIDMFDQVGAEHVYVSDEDSLFDDDWRSELNMTPRPSPGSQNPMRVLSSKQVLEGTNVLGASSNSANTTTTSTATEAKDGGGGEIEEPTAQSMSTPTKKSGYSSDDTGSVASSPQLTTRDSLLHQRDECLSPMANDYSLNLTLQMAIEVQIEDEDEELHDDAATMEEEEEEEEDEEDEHEIILEEEQGQEREKKVDTSFNDISSEIALKVPFVGTDNEPCSPIEELRTLLDDLDDWERFDIFKVGQLAPLGPLLLVGFAIYERHGFFQSLELPIPETQSYLWALQNRYMDNPYHNSMHAADVGQSLSHFFVRCGLNRYADTKLRFACLFAALAHDVGHPGVTNGFLVQTWHPLAIRYNDRSPLEMMHSSIAFELLRRPDCNMLKPFENDDRYVFRKNVISLILATDNAEHDALLSRLSKVSQAISNSGTPNVTSDMEQLTILEAALHAADISSSGKPWHIYQQWTERLCVEFRNQGDLEKERGLAVLPFMDRTIKLPISRFQAGFMEAIVQPLYEALHQVPDVDISRCVELIALNVSRWKRRQDDDDDDDDDTNNGNGGSRSHEKHLEKVVLKNRAVTHAAQTFLNGAHSSSPPPKSTPPPRPNSGAETTASPPPFPNLDDPVSTFANIPRPYHRFKDIDKHVQFTEKRLSISSNDSTKKEEDKTLSEQGQHLFSSALK